MAKRIVAWHKELLYEVPYNPGLRGNPNIEIREEEILDENGIPEIDDKPPVISGELADVIEAIGELDLLDPSHFTKGGLPDARGLTERCGFVVTKVLRDKAWAIIQQRVDTE